MDDTALAKVLQSIADGQKAIVEEIKKLSGGPSADLVPTKMPDGRVAMLPRSALSASTKGMATGLSVVEKEELAAEPWPDPQIPKPKVVR